MWTNSEHHTATVQQPTITDMDSCEEWRSGVVLISTVRRLEIDINLTQVRPLCGQAM